VLPYGGGKRLSWHANWSGAETTKSRPKAALAEEEPCAVEPAIASVIRQDALVRLFDFECDVVRAALSNIGARSNRWEITAIDPQIRQRALVETMEFGENGAPSQPRLGKGEQAVDNSGKGELASGGWDVNGTETHGELLEEDGAFRPCWRL